MIFIKETQNEREDIWEYTRSLEKISHKQAITKAHSEYNKYKEKIGNELSKVEKDFIEYIRPFAKLYI